MSEDDEIRATEALRRRIEAAYERGLIEYQTLSLLVRPTNKSYIQQFVTRETPKKMPPWMREQLARALDQASEGRPQKAKSESAPASEDDGWIVGEAAVAATLRRIKGLSDDDRRFLLKQIKSAWIANGVEPLQNHPHDQLQSATPRRAG
ncbi:hypothetical protein [Mesorhizobium sp. Root172]|uniref:hypothetical protein n=1 Tax=Mesorhizobium sp. Root172 TaxID=1736481 RepID=UPI00070029D6|nr:hypothetical protein [Mesorhizobium sp. Root172]KRB26298.1 hypothetical protein ASE05_10340 [Mesorhizobium sp. Root172]